MNLQTSKPFKSLPRDFYLGPTKKVVKDLIGKILQFEGPQGMLAAIITETEAYVGVKDKACHLYKGRTTERVKPLYLEGGHSYIYLIYGLHYCLNAVTRPKGDPQAVLIRAAVPIVGEEIMKKNRGEKINPKDLANGPGKLCQALGLTKKQNELDLTNSNLQICEPPKIIKYKIKATPRIGIDYAEEWTEKNLRFYAIPN